MDETIKSMHARKTCVLQKYIKPWGFKDSEEELLYNAYIKTQRQRVIPRLLAMGVLLQAFLIFVPGGSDLLSAYIYITVSILVNLTLAVLYYWLPNVRHCLDLFTWFALWGQILFGTFGRVGDSFNELLGWAVLLQYFTVATIPFHYVLLIVCSIFSITTYMLIQRYNALISEHKIHDYNYQQLANGLILIASTLLGATAYYINDREQRTSFQETKSSLRDKLTIEQQSKEQERLLLSVLPEHVAVQMRKDLGLIDTQFKKIYMSRHENVSILYADIVGFTAISSTYSAQDLVAILNELFARFDRLAEKYQQLRIKILGDCYYCISGAPVERPDHAVLCVHMGLSMVKAIKYVQQTTNSPVDMRVGIHTGAVLAGVLGQRQWQFDVYSRDVELANKMESSGMAGRVHVSEVTLGFLNNEFEVEPAYGERREEMLRQAGIKTYFIVRVLKSHQGGEEKTASGEGKEGGDATDGDALSDLRDDDEDSVLSPQDDTKDSEEQKILTMLRDELVQRDDDKELADTTTLCLTFKDDEAEQWYVRQRDPCIMSVAVPPAFFLPAITVLAHFAVPRTWEILSVYLAFLLEMGIIYLIYYSVFRYTIIKQKDLNAQWKVTCGIFNTAMIVVVNITVLMGVCAACILLWVPMGACVRALLLLVLAAAHVIPALLEPTLLRPRPGIDNHPYREPYNVTTDYNENLFAVLSWIHSARNIIMLFFIVIALIIVDRFTESLERARHSRSQRMRAQAEQAGDLRHRNQALIHNVLPPHVASHFMGARHHHRDLYSQSYAEVGVLFASMPNFSEFYSEETVNNQGLECLRFLNEVISDFDLLLEEDKFKDIIKIKTISSTYMAASGLNPKRLMQPSDGVSVRWAHLARLVEFALELQRVLSAINEQSFNHFVLRMGVNHGPITAGVIGARKPHYDIWGNTVNVASRMESTGKAGCIQVTEETCHILESFGYYFEQRGLVAVKGKGQLMTYYLQGRRDAQPESADTLKMEAGALSGAGAGDPLKVGAGAWDPLGVDAGALDPLIVSAGENDHPHIGAGTDDSLMVNGAVPVAPLSEATAKPNEAEADADPLLQK